MNRRGFTLLETILAALIGSLVLGACIGLFGLLDRSDRRLGARFQDVMAMERLRSTVSRAVGSLVMSSDPQPPGSDGRTLPETLPAGAPPLPPPRFILEPDRSPALTGVLRRADIAGKEGSAPQRLEVVLAKSPVPVRPGVRPGPAHGRRAVRGVFELRPDVRRERGSYQGKGGGWTLWWRPLPVPEGPTTGASPKGAPDPRSIEPGDDPEATKVMTGLERCQWTVYQNRQKKSEHSAIWYLGLPAYVELSVRTTAGVTASWMFEVGWSNSPEVVEDPPVPAPGEEAAPGGAGPQNTTGDGTTNTRPDGGARRMTPTRPVN